MTQVYDQAVPIVNLPFLYINGAGISNNATTPNTLLDVAAGQMRDQSNTYDMNIGNFNGQVQPNATANVTTTINAAVIGLNGIDTGAFAASKVYNVYVVSDPVSGQASGAMISLGAPSIGPVMPFGYSAYRHIGYAVSDATVHFLLAYISGNNNYRLFVYDVPIATAVTAGNSATYADVALSTFVPTVNNTPVLIECNWTANAAADTLALHARNAVGDTVKYIAAVAGATAHTLVRDYVQAQFDTGLPEIQYKVSAGTVAINVAGFQFFI